jgi:hypothetical protein
MEMFWGCFFEGFLLDVTYEDLVPICLVILLQETLRHSFIWWFSVESMIRCS